MSTHVQIPTCPVTLLKDLFALIDDQKVVANMLGRCFDRGRFVHFTSFLVDESVDAIAGIVNVHEDLVVFATRRVKCKEITVRSILSQSITQHHAILDNVELNGVLSITLSTEGRELRIAGDGGSHGVVSFADVISIGQIRAVRAPPVTVLGLAQGRIQLIS